MARKSIEREQNQHGHRYQWWEPGKVNICLLCGTAEHRNGKFYWAGRWSKVEPPCGSSEKAQREWYDAANPDDEMPGAFDAYKS